MKSGRPTPAKVTKVKKLLAEKPKAVHAQFIRYVLVAGVAATADTTMLWFLNARLGINPLLAAAAGFTLGLVVNYLLSVAWVFEGSGKLTSEFTLFALVGIGGLGWTELILWVCVDRVGMPVMAAKMTALGLVMGWNFGMRRRFVFKASSRPLRGAIAL